MLQTMGGGCYITFVMLIMSSLVACLTQVRFGKFGHLKSGHHSCQSEPQDSVNLQSVKNRSITLFPVANSRLCKYDFVASREQ